MCAGYLIYSVRDSLVYNVALAVFRRVTQTSLIHIKAQRQSLQRSGGWLISPCSVANGLVGHHLSAAASAGASAEYLHRQTCPGPGDGRLRLLHLPRHTSSGPRLSDSSAMVAKLGTGAAIAGPFSCRGRFHSGTQLTALFATSCSAQK